VTLTGADIAAGQTAVINIDTADGTAINPADFGDLQNVDYNAATGQLTVTGPFAAGTAVATLTVATVDDAIPEGTENFDVNITAATVDGAAANVVDNVAGSDLIDNDTPTFTLAGNASVTEGSTASYAITTDLPIGAGQIVVIDIDTVDGTAINPADFGDLQNASYNAATGQLTVTGPFAAGATIATLTLDMIDDAVIESTEYFDVNITAATVDGVAAYVVDSVAGVSVADNDTLTLTLSSTALDTGLPPDFQAEPELQVEPGAFGGYTMEGAVDPANHVLPAVNESVKQRAAMMLRLSGAFSVADVSEIQSESLVADHPLDPALFVLPAVEAVRLEAAAAQAQAQVLTTRFAPGTETLFNDLADLSSFALLPEVVTAAASATPPALASIPLSRNVANAVEPDAVTSDAGAPATAPRPAGGLLIGDEQADDASASAAERLPRPEQLPRPLGAASFAVQVREASARLRADPFAVGYR